MPPDTFNLIRTNTLLLEDIKTCTRYVVTYLYLLHLYYI